MEIFFSDIPEEGLPFSGKLEPSYFNLTGEDSIRITGELEYDLTIYAFEEAVVLSGAIRGPVELQCVTCLDFFLFVADFPEWQSEVDIEENQVSFDPREGIRDEILLSLPTTPHCDEMQEDHECPKLEILARFEGGGIVEEADPAPSGDSAWGILDQFRKEK